MLKQKYRLKKSIDFQNTKQDGQYIPNKFFHFYFIQTKEKDSSKVGIVVSRNFDKRATKRNLMKRRFREILRLNSDNIPNGINIVIYPKFSAQSVKYEELSSEVIKTLQKVVIT